MSTTIKDVAKKAGVSIATVSLAIQNNSRISTATRNKVLRVIKELNYHPSRSAKGLVTKTTGNIGFVLTDDHFLKTEPFYTMIFLGTEFVTRGNNYYVLLATIKREFTEDDELPRFILEQSVDGIIIAGKVPEIFLRKLSSYNIPLVFVDFFPPTGKHSVVMVDNINGGFIATKHLIDLGHKNIAFLGADITHPSISERLTGYKQALESSNIKIDPKLIITDEDYPARQNGYNAAKRLLEMSKSVTAIFACNDAMAIGVMQYCADNHINIPNDISLVGFDDVEADLMLNPPLTTVRVPKVELGIEAMNMIISMISDKSNHHPKKILVPVELIIRNSTKRI
ncbi:LacI family DNA-binding transcriptional regulator [Melioribacteraceae bacterium 4301-Me]|uniref:LacI family DNA-binding transcriptional regulator n=1 Tax=Pyranulibacter aquaticus TaxID=3163344 RepID=UPI003597D1D0